MKLSQIKAVKPVFTAVDPVEGKAIEDVKITFKSRSDKEAYEKFSNMVASGGLDTPAKISGAFIEIIDELVIGDFASDVDGLTALLESPDAGFIGDQLVDFFANKSNFYQVEKAKKKS